MTNDIYKGNLDRNYAEDILSQPVAAQLATVNPHNLQPHVVPVWFAWDGESLWVNGFTSTRKIRELTQNQRCSILVNSDPKATHAVLLEGMAELITEPCHLVYEKSIYIYTKYMGMDGAQANEPQSWAKDPENLIVRLQPKKIYSW